MKKLSGEARARALKEMVARLKASKLGSKLPEERRKELKIELSFPGEPSKAP